MYNRWADLFFFFFFFFFSFFSFSFSFSFSFFFFFLFSFLFPFFISRATLCSVAQRDWKRKLGLRKSNVLHSSSIK
ncbi:hypothetical protein BDV23DRAFT_165584 [Aspergillus alliaceus]|uniref:Uncharacterized protein n=1 Tax=Petromyces alliaceus TaxID=209559 RepID=A0A5N7BU62_PETAA|nr:hypothetical protein BDV23DRAFT_165584 [Aspergillus alliaceus]